MDLTEKKIESTLLYDGKIIQMYRDTVLLPNGKTAIREVAAHCGGVGILPITKDGDVILVKQFRYCFGREILEIPAGKMDVGGETPKESIVRELKEETGYAANTIVDLGVCFPSPGCFTEKLYIFMATDLIEGETCPDEDEFLEIVKMPFAELLEKVMSGEIEDAKTIIATLKAARLLKK